MVMFVAAPELRRDAMTTQRGFTDRLGLSLSTHSALAAERYVQAVDKLQALDVGAAEGFEAAIEADEGFALALAGLAYARFAQMRPEAATAAIERAEALAGGITRREQGHIAVMRALIGRDSRGLAIADEHLAEFPTDALVRGAWIGLMVVGGILDWKDLTFTRFTELAPKYGDDPFFLASFSFIHHELNRFEQARRMAERSLQFYPRGGQAAHSLAHVFYETNGHADGAAWLGGWMADYSRAAPQFCHLSWHRALFALAAGRYAETLALYERDISPAVTMQLSTLVDAASLLWRHGVYRCSIGPLPWQPVQELATKVGTRPGFAFADVHVALACAATGDDAGFSRLIDGLRELAAKGHPTAGSVVLPLALGVGAFAHGDYAEAIRQIEPVASQIVRVGGSNAQRAVFEDTLIEAYLRAEQFEKAESLLRVRLGRRSSARDLFWLGRAQSGAGRASEADENLAQAQAAWSTADADSPELAAIAQLRGSLATSR
jgi:tetratricopeptide (TPR) repeat protein